MARISGARVMAQMMAGYGVTHVFMVPAVLRRTLAEMERHTDIARLHVHGEKSAAYMADGYARASGRPGVCFAQNVGALNLCAGLRDAWLGHSPVLALTGGWIPELKYKRSYQDAYDLPAFEQYTKWNASVEDVRRFPDMLRQAFRTATTGCPGPVHLQFLGNEGFIDCEEADFDDIVIEKDYAALPPFRPVPELSRVRAALEGISRAQKPIIVAGGGARASGAGEALRSFADALQIPVATSLNGRDTIPSTHPLCVGVVGTYSRSSANRTVAEADLVIYVGSETGGMTTHFWTVPKPGTRVMQIDIEPQQLGRNYPLEVAILGDARTTLELMQREAVAFAQPDRSQWLAQTRQFAGEWRAGAADKLNSDAVPIRPERICMEMTRTLPDDALVVVDTGHAGMWLGGFYDLTSPRQSYIRCMGHLGWAFPAGLGAKCAVPDRPVITFTGDLGMWYHIAEIETAVRWGINAITIVNNNRSGNQSTMGFHRAYEGKPTEKSREMWVHNEVNFARVAEEIGALGLRVERPQELGGAIEKALKAKRPTVIDVATDIDILAPHPGRVGLSG